VTTKPPFRIAPIAVLAVLLLAFAPVATAAPPGGGHGGGGTGGTGGKGTCTQKAPGVVVDNTWAWGTPGSWAVAGQTVTYAIDVLNYDTGCGSSTFNVNVSAPAGFSVSLSTSSITLRSAGSGYVTVNVTGPSGSADGDYPLTVTATRAGSPSSAGSYETYYKVYSTDTVAPRLYWATPADGTTISGSSYNVSVSSDDDHTVKSIELYIDGAYKSTTTCDGISYRCQLIYTWSIRGLQGQHTATFRSYDGMGNVGTLTTTFTIG
jgi:Bacterial Ig domain/NPCBM-associated, NEW3 domain of alpha-galactosidase